VSTLGWLYLASGRTRRLLAWSLLAAAISIPAIVIGAVAGSINSVAIWYAGSSLIIAPLAFVVAAPLAGLTFRRVAEALAGSASAALAMAGIVTALNIAMAGANPALRLVAAIAIGMLAYALLAYRTTAATEAREALFSLKSSHVPSIVDEPVGTPP
jgi:O-antigen/teichoic acid export membrane protein